MFKGAARLLRAGGVTPTSKTVSSLVRLARSFNRDGVPKYTALSDASRYWVRRYQVKHNDNR